MRRSVFTTRVVPDAAEEQRAMAELRVLAFEHATPEEVARMLALEARNAQLRAECEALDRQQLRRRNLAFVTVVLLCTVAFLFGWMRK